MPSPVYSHEFEVIFHILPMPPVADDHRLCFEDDEPPLLTPVAESAGNRGRHP